MRKSPDTIIPLLLAILAGNASLAQLKTPLFATGDLPGSSVEKVSAYKGKALYGYIDGGAEIFLEYGFRSAVVQDIVSDSHRVHLEVFEMASREAAAGIYSVSSRGCQQSGDPWTFTCSSRFQVQKALGRYFLRAANESGTSGEKDLTAAVVNVVAAKIKDSTYSPPSLFADTLFRSGRPTFLIACGPLGLENGLDEWREIAEAAEGFCLKVLVQESELGTSKTALLEFGPGGNVAFAPARWEEGAPAGSHRIALDDGPRRFILCETTGGRATAEQYRGVIEKYRLRDGGSLRSR